jgi:hypothetical protein
MVEQRGERDLLYSSKAAVGPCTRLARCGGRQTRVRDEILDDFIFCKAIREGRGFRIAHELQITSAWIRYRLKRGGEITGFLEPMKPYNLRDGQAKALNDSCK